MQTDTVYLGMRLPHPFMAGASPMSADLDTVKRLEDVGCAAIVMHSLFEEQITHADAGTIRHMDPLDEQFAAALSYYPRLTEYRLAPRDYLEHLRQVKAAVKIPVIASLNGTTAESWMKYARLLEQAGADALEVNMYDVVTDLDVPGLAIETMLRNLVVELKRALRIPVAVKLSPFFSAFGNVARQLDRAGADGLVLFNRFYQPDFDLEKLEAVPTLTLSSSYELLLRLHWAAILYGHIRADLAVTGGVHTAQDVLKAMMAGARVAMMTSALLRIGIEHLKTVRAGLLGWMEEHEYGSVRQMQGSMSYRSVAQPAAFERANYMKVLGSYTLQP